MSLDRLDLLSVKAADGVASAADLAELAAAGVEPRQWDSLRTLLTEALSTHTTPPDLVSDIFTQLDLTEDIDVTGAVQDALGAEGPDLVSDIFAQLELTEDADVTGAINDALGAAGPDLVSGIFAELDLAEDMDITGAVQDALDASGPDLVSGIFAELELAEDLDVTGAIRDALGTLEEPELAGDVLSTLGLSDDALGAEVAAALSSTATSPELADGVMDTLGASSSVGDVLRDVLSSDGAPDLWGDIAAEIGAVDGVSGAVRDALSSDSSPDLWAGIAAEIGAEAEEAVVVPAAVDNVVPLRNWASAGLGALLAVAAAMLLVVVSGQGDLVEKPSLWDTNVELVDNTAHIEELESSPDAMVQFFQTEAGAPTILYINELEPTDDAGTDEGEL
ncbi:MAG: hypothetical protein ACI8S6_003100 [Myxococcota bacterium]|jgi:hypothetical protein